MKKNRSYTLIVLFLLLVVSLTACVKDLPAPKTEKPKAVEPTKAATEMIDIIYEFTTQTAIALSQPNQGTPEATPLAPVATAVVIAPAATAVPVIAPLVVPASYILQKDEFVYCIARRFNVNPDELMALNGMNRSSGQMVSPGLSLKIPQTGNIFPAARALRAHPTTYTVVGGETIYKIACLFGDVDPLAIATLNGLVAPYNLTAGQTLNIP